MNATTNSGGLSLDRVEYVFSVFALFVITGGMEMFLTVLVGQSSAQTTGDHSDSNPLKLLMNISVYGLAILMAMRRQDKFFRIIAENWLLLVIACTPLLSIFWSVDPVTTIRRSMAVSLTGLFVFYLVATMSPEEMLRRLTLALFVGGVLSVATAILVPSFAVQSDVENYGAWRGLYGFKAELGRVGAFAVTLPFFMQPLNRQQTLIKWGTIATFMLLLFMSQSRTNWVCAASGLGMGVVLLILQPSRLSGAMRISAAILVVVTATVVGYLLMPVIFEIFDRDATLSGRSVIWESVLSIMQEKWPIFGSGYGTFFTPRGGSLDVAARLSYWSIVPGHAHNGYINTYIETGWVGAVALGILMASVFVNLLRRAHAEARRCWIAFFVALTIFAINNYSSSVSFTHSDLAWVLLLTGALYSSVVASPADKPKEAPSRVQYVSTMIGWSSNKPFLTNRVSLLSRLSQQ